MDIRNVNTGGITIQNQNLIRNEKCRMQKSYILPVRCKNSLHIQRNSRPLYDGPDNYIYLPYTAYQGLKVGLRLHSLLCPRTMDQPTLHC